MNRTLFIDFDGTICHDRFWRSLPGLAQTKVQQFLFVENSQKVADWMRGRYTSEEINMFVARGTGIPYTKLWETFVSDCKTMYVAQETLDLIKAARKTFHVVLITGNMDSLDRFTIPNIGLDRYFDTIVNSFNEKQLKTDVKGESFQKYLNGDIKNASLIEDSVNSCRIFNDIGGMAYQVTHETSANDHLRTVIKKWG